MSLNDMACRTAKPQTKKFKLYDSEGLYLEIIPSGKKYWKLKYRAQGKEKRVALGVYPQVSLAEARKKKLELKETIKLGKNPVLVRLEQRLENNLAQTQTFEKVALEWHQKQLGVWEPRYAQTILHRLEKYAFPFLGQYPINEIKPITVLACLQKIEVTAPEMARRIKLYCHQVFMYAIASSRTETDPTQGLQYALKKYKKGHFASITVDELPKFLFDLHEHRARLTRQTFLAIKLMVLTFLRTSELIKAEWSEIDFDRALWSIPAERMKMDRPHLVSLSRQATKILEELKEMNGHRQHIFPSLPRPKTHMSNGTILVALTRMGYKNKMTGHGFRSLAMGVLKEKLSYSHEIVDRQLAHARKSGNDRAYDRALFLPQRSEMLQRFADYIDQIYIEELKRRISSGK